MLPPHQIRIAPEVLLDSRLALFHQNERWLALADLHFGFELSQRSAGRLVPFWGMEATSARLLQLLDDYCPRLLILLGDLVHDHAAAEPLRRLLLEAAKRCQVIALAGNHDRRLRHFLTLVDSFTTVGFAFHHGHCKCELPGRIKVIGHHHPAASLRDGAGLHLKFPAFVKERDCWIMPAFSPWSSGTIRPACEQSRTWLCTPHRILPLESRETAA